MHKLTKATDYPPADTEVGIQLRLFKLPTSTAKIALQFTRPADVIMNTASIALLYQFSSWGRRFAMSKKLLALILASIAISSLSNLAQAAEPNYPTEAYDALYVRKSEQGISDYRYCTDGEGHVRIETTPPTSGYQISGEKPSKSVTIFDYPNKIIYTLLEKQKLAIKQPMHANASAAPLSATRIKEMHGEDLGKDKKFNHMCQGYKWTENGVTTEQWIALDLKCPMHTETQSEKSGSETMHLEKIRLVDGDPRDYEVPADYKITDMSAAATAK